MWRRFLKIIMRYLRIIRDNEQIFITIGDYIYENQPEVYNKLLQWNRTCREKQAEEFAKARVRNITKQVLKARKPEGFWARLQSESPKPGRGGLLPWETELDL